MEEKEFKIKSKIKGIFILFKVKLFGLHQDEDFSLVYLSFRGIEVRRLHPNG